MSEPIVPIQPYPATHAALYNGWPYEHAQAHAPAETLAVPTPIVRVGRVIWKAGPQDAAEGPRLVIDGPGGRYEVLLGPALRASGIEARLCLGDHWLVEGALLHWPGRAVIEGQALLPLESPEAHEATLGDAEAGSTIDRYS